VYYAHASGAIRGTRCIWVLPLGNSDFSTRWSLIRGQLRAIEKGEHISQSRLKRGERGLWQRRFSEHLIRDEDDFNRMSITSTGIR
jgi:REP-associated tyrosine transposase